MGLTRVQSDQSQTKHGGQQARVFNLNSTYLFPCLHYGFLYFRYPPCSFVVCLRDLAQLPGMDPGRSAATLAYNEAQDNPFVAVYYDRKAEGRTNIHQSCD